MHVVLKKRMWHCWNKQLELNIIFMVLISVLFEILSVSCMRDCFYPTKILVEFRTKKYESQKTDQDLDDHLLMQVVSWKCRYHIQMKTELTVNLF